MRAANSIKNARTNIIFNMAVLILNFVSRYFFIKYLGETLNGFNSVVTGILGVLNIAEAGIASAVSFSLYKPLAENDSEKVNEVMVIFKRMYTGIGIFVTIAGLMVIPFLGYFTKGYLPISEAIGYYIIYLMSTATSYFFSYKQTLICADQKEYRIKTIIGTSMITKTILQILVIILLKNYFIWIILNLVFNIGNLFVVNYRIDKEYPQITFKSNKSFKEIAYDNKLLIKNMKNTFYHKFGEIIITQVDPLIITGFSTIIEAGRYTNYTMITNGLIILVNSLLQAFYASIGNLIAESNEDNCNNVFKQLISFSSYLSTVICFGLFMSVNIFIEILYGSDKIFNNFIVFLIVMNLYVVINRVFIDSYKAGYGIYWDVAAPLIEGILSVFLGILIATQIGIAGVLLGKLISIIIVGVMWKPYTIYKFGFKMKVSSYYIQYSINIVLGFIAALISYNLVNFVIRYFYFSNRILNFILVGFLSVFFIGVIYLLFSIINKDFRLFLKRIKNMVFK